MIQDQAGRVAAVGEAGGMDERADLSRPYLDNLPLENFQRLLDQRVVFEIVLAEGNRGGLWRGGWQHVVGGVHSAEINSSAEIPACLSTPESVPADRAMIRDYAARTASVPEMCGSLAACRT